MVLHNTGKVATSFSVVRHTLSRGNVVEVLPAIGRVPPGEKTKLLVRLLPGLPMRIKETFLLQVAHFEPVPIAIGAEGIYSRVTLNLPREETVEFASFMATAEEAIAKQRAAMENFNAATLATLEADAPGGLDPAELLEALKKNGGRVLDLFNDWDKDRDGKVSKVEFRKAVALVGFKARISSIDAVFDMFDPDNSGTIELKELKVALSSQVAGSSALAMKMVSPPQTAGTMKSFGGSQNFGGSQAGGLGSTAGGGSVVGGGSGAGPGSAVGGGSIAGSAAYAPPPPKSVTSERPSERPTEATTAAGGKKKKGGKKAKAKEDDTGGRSEEQIQTEAEAERLHLVAYTEKQLAEHAAALEAARLAADEERRATGRPTSAASRVSGSRRGRASARHVAGRGWRHCWNRCRRRRRRSRSRRTCSTLGAS